GRAARGQEPRDPAGVRPDRLPGDLAEAGAHRRADAARARPRQVPLPGGGRGGGAAAGGRQRRQGGVVKLPEVHEVGLETGFRALVVPRPALPLVATVVWYRVGSRDERTGETGLSHFLEHMMFKGTDRYRKGEIDLLTSKMGGSNNAFTDNDAT